MAHRTIGSSWLSLFRGTHRGPGGRKIRASRTTRLMAIEPLEERVVMASNWTQLTNAPPSAVGTMMLLTDGTVIAESYVGARGVSNLWYKLTPDTNGSYVNGTWSSIATMGLQRLYFGSNMLQNGNVFVVGGEYSGATGAAALYGVALKNNRFATCGSPRSGY